VAWGLWFAYQKGWAAYSLSRISGQLEHSVTQALSREGVTDRDVVAQVRKEHGWHFVTWVETSRTLYVKTPRQSTAIVHALKKVADDNHCSLEKIETPQGLAIRLKWFLWVPEQITLATKGPLTASGSVPAHSKVPRVAFVIDDVAYETASMDHFASLQIPLTFAILPREKHSKELSQKANGLHFPVMLHLPMEPLDMVHNDPGPTGMYLKMNDQELKSQFEKNVASVPNIVGINNHMGSAFTESEPKMTLVMQWVKSKGVYFLDSHTTGKSVVCKEAKRIGVPCLVNETFLDNQDDVKSIESQLDVVIKLAVKEGQTIAIGHYRRKFLVQALANKLPEFKSRGIEVVTLPTFFRR